MKIDMNEFGKLILTPETGVELFALKKWQQQSYIKQQDIQRVEDGHYLGSSIEVVFLTPGEVT